MDFRYVVSLHIIFIVTWFAGLFYIVRLFIYFAEASLKQETEKTILQSQYQIMQKRLWYGITWPSAILTAILGFTLIAVKYHYTIPNWLWVKLAFVTFLYGYHFWCHAIFKQQEKGKVKYTSSQLRIFNEVATIFLFAIVFLVEVQDGLSWAYGLMSVAILAIILFLGFRVYKNIRESR